MTKKKDRRFPDVQRRGFTNLYKSLSLKDAEQFQQCLLWKIFGYWTPQRSGRVADFMVGDTINYDNEQGFYFYKEGLSGALGSAFSSQSMNRLSGSGLIGQKGTFARARESLTTVKFSSELTSYLDFHLFMIRNKLMMNKKVSIFENSLLTNPVFWINREKKSAKPSTINFWLKNVCIIHYLSL